MALKVRVAEQPQAEKAIPRKNNPFSYFPFLLKYKMSNAASEFQDDVVISEKQSQTDEDQLTLRALVSTKEAGVIIGKGGKNVAELRDATGVKAGVSKVVQGVHDRVLTVSGTLEGVAKVSFCFFQLDDDWLTHLGFLFRLILLLLVPCWTTLSIIITPIPIRRLLLQTTPLIL
jgi:predicted RNA-binding protein YlqC (UPF0109 family)